MRMLMIWSESDPAQSLRRKAKEMRRMADRSRDLVIADELRTLAERFVSRAFELECAPHAPACNDNATLGRRLPAAQAQPHA